MVDRVLKAFDTLKAAPADAASDNPQRKRERLAACTQLAETVCAPATRASSDFQKASP